MTIKDTKMLLEAVKKLYPEFILNEDVIIIWQEITRFAFYKDFYDCLVEYAKTSSKTPKIADLTNIWKYKGFDNAFHEIGQI